MNGSGGVERTQARRNQPKPPGIGQGVEREKRREMGVVPQLQKREEELF